MSNPQLECDSCELPSAHESNHNPNLTSKAPADMQHAGFYGSPTDCSPISAAYATAVGLGGTFSALVVSALLLYAAGMSANLAILIASVLLGAGGLIVLAIAAKKMSNHSVWLPGFQEGKGRSANYVSLACLLLAIVLSVAFARSSESASNYKQFTQLWMQAPTDNTSEGLEIGIRSYESKVTTFLLSLGTGYGEERSWSEIVLQPGETWTIAVSPPGPNAEGMPLVARLFRSDAPKAIYRQVEVSAR